MAAYVWQVDPVQPTGDEFGRFSCSPMASSDDLPRPHGKTKRTPAAPQTNGFTRAKLPPPGQSAPPYDSQRMRPAARARSPDKFVDMELGLGPKAPGAKPEAVSSSSVGVVVVASAAAPVASGLVLPCPPSDDEKVMLYRSIRTRGY